MTYQDELTKVLTQMPHTWWEWALLTPAFIVLLYVVIELIRNYRDCRALKKRIPEDFNELL